MGKLTIQSRAEVRAIFLNVDKPLAEKSPRPGHRRVKAIHQNTRGWPWRIQSSSITITREPTTPTADCPSASTTLHYKQSFCQNGLIWEGVRRREQRKTWKEKKWQSVRKPENRQRTQMKQVPPERPPNDPSNDPWFMSCQTQDPGPSLTTTWSAQLPAPPRPFFIPNHQVKKMSLPPIQKRYVRGMTKGTVAPCSKPNMLESYIIWSSKNPTEYMDLTHKSL